jgi:S1-C subfamily serine protease
MAHRLSIVIALALIIGRAPLVAGPDWSAVSKQVAPSIVYVEGDGGCTGFVIDTARKYVLSAAHCDVEREPKRLWVDRVEGHVVSKDTKKDLLVIEVKDLDPARPALKLASSDPAIQQEVLSVGYGYALERPMFRRVSIADDKMTIAEEGIGGPLLAIDAAFVPGQSGGAVVNADGDVVMIVQRTSDRMGVGIGASLIRDRVGRFWGAEPSRKQP